MRRILNALYDTTAALAAVFMVGLFLMVLLTIFSRQLNFHVPGTDAYAGYLMAAAGFLSLAHTLKRGEHIRVTLLRNSLKGIAQKGLELWALGFGTALASLFAWYSVKLVWDSYLFDDISTSSDATPLWIPQLSMAIGAVIFAISLADEWVLEFRSRREQVTPEEPLRNE